MTVGFSGLKSSMVLDRYHRNRISLLSDSMNFHFDLCRTKQFSPRDPFRSILLTSSMILSSQGLLICHHKKTSTLFMVRARLSMCSSIFYSHIQISPTMTAIFLSQILCLIHMSSQYACSDLLDRSIASLAAL